MGQRHPARGPGAGAILHLADALTSVLLAPRCAACEQPLDHPSRGAVCERCWDGVRPLRPPFCVRCGGELLSWRRLLDTARCASCTRRRSAVDRARAAAEYDGPMRRIVQALKYEGRRSLAVPLGRLLREAGADLLQGASGIVPVPLHPVRRLARGFNQARDLAARLPLEMTPLLWRLRATTPQESLSAAARRRNVRGAFIVSPLLGSRRRARLLEGRTLVLVDDVRTTGATLDQCAAALKAAGAREVRALTVAIARPRDRRPGAPGR